MFGLWTFVRYVCFGQCGRNAGAAAAWRRGAATMRVCDRARSTRSVGQHARQDRHKSRLLLTVYKLPFLPSHHLLTFCHICTVMSVIPCMWSFIWTGQKERQQLLRQALPRSGYSIVLSLSVCFSIWHACHLHYAYLEYCAQYPCPLSSPLLFPWYSLITDGISCFSVFKYFCISCIYLNICRIVKDLIQKIRLMGHGLEIVFSSTWLHRKLQIMKLK